MSALPALTHEAKQLLQLLPQVDHLEELMTAVMGDMFETPCTAEDFVRLRNFTSLDSRSLGSVFTGLHWLLRACMRSGLKAKALTSELKELAVHPPCIPSIVAAAEDGRSRESQALDGSNIPSLETLRWRLDVPISTGMLPKVFRPHITLQASLTDGRTESFHVSKQRFDELRFTVASLNAQMLEIPSRLQNAGHPT